MPPQLKEMVSAVSDVLPQMDISLLFQSYAPFFQNASCKKRINNPVNSDFLLL
jgi:hypothetical protein